MNCHPKVVIKLPTMDSEIWLICLVSDTESFITFQNHHTAFDEVKSYILNNWHEIIIQLVEKDIAILDQLKAFALSIATDETSRLDLCVIFPTDFAAIFFFVLKEEYLLRRSSNQNLIFVHDHVSEVEISYFLNIEIVDIIALYFKTKALPIECMDLIL